MKPIPMIFDEVNDGKTHIDRVQILKANRNSMVDFLLELAFSADVGINLPEGEPPYLRTGEANYYNAYLLYANRKTIELLVNNNATHIPVVKREQVFIDMLENLDPLEAKLLCEIKDKNLKSYPNIDNKLIETVYDFKLVDPKPVIEITETQTEDVQEPQLETVNLFTKQEMSEKLKLTIKQLNDRIKKLEIVAVAKLPTDKRVKLFTASQFEQIAQI